MFRAREMKLVLYRLCLILVICGNVEVFARIFTNLERSMTEIMRSTRFVPKVAKKMCLLKPQKGPCRGNLEMYYFDPSTLNCSTFTWGGCQGNGNRFDTEDECVDYCRTKRDTRKLKPYWCQLTFDYGYCFGDVSRYYYDPLYQVCKETIYSGCGGNKNNFYTKSQCESVCIHGLGFTTKSFSSTPQFKTVVIVNPPNTTPPRGRAQNIDNGSNGVTVGKFIRKYINDSGTFYETVMG